MQMLHSTLRGSIGEFAHALIFQRAALDLHKNFPPLCFNVKVNARAGENRLRADKGHIFKKPWDKFAHCLVGTLAVHIYEHTVLVNGDKVILCLACRIVGAFENYLRTVRKQLLAPPRVLHMNGLNLSVNIDPCNKSVGAGDEFSPAYFTVSDGTSLHITSDALQRRIHRPDDNRDRHNLCR